jgi:hypothetical protein
VGLQSIEPDNLVRFQQWCADQSLGMVIVGQEGVSPVYGNAAVPVTPGKAWTYRVYFGKDPVGFC